MKIGILGTRGIPNNYGGYEQITEHLAAGLVLRGHDVTVYNSHNHPYQLNNWNGVTIHHCYDPEYLINTAGQFIYDLNCLRHARTCDFDVLLFMGYTSSSVWHRLYPKRSVIVSNMDGLEWKRTKYSFLTRRFLKHAEKLAVRHSRFHIADSPAIKAILDKRYHINCEFIPYGATEFNLIQPCQLKPYGLHKEQYYLLMARMEPENNIEMILHGFHKSNTDKRFLVIGRNENKYGKYLTKKFACDERIRFTGGIFNQSHLHMLRANAALYFHGHSVGGTNPSLLEAMASRVLIAAHANPFNKAVLGEDAFYFTDHDKIKELIEKPVDDQHKKALIANNHQKIINYYKWERIISLYEAFLVKCYKEARL